MIECNKEDIKTNKKRTFIQMDIDPDTKAYWKSFTGIGKRFNNLTSFIKYCINGYLLGDLIEKRQIVVNRSEELFNLEKEESQLINEQHKILSEIENLRQDLSEQTQEQEIDTLPYKKLIYGILKLKKVNRNQITEIIGLKDLETQKILNELEFKEKMITHDSQYFYSRTETEE